LSLAVAVAQVHFMEVRLAVAVALEDFVQEQHQSLLLPV
jgi:hypothetical protein